MNYFCRVSVLNVIIINLMQTSKGLRAAHFRYYKKAEFCTQPLPQTAKHEYRDFTDKRLLTNFLNGNTPKSER
jgi:hypothetical protein